jgi:branched-subunit amino acid ABC-type transport system permease component
MSYKMHFVSALALAGVAGQALAATGVITLQPGSSVTLDTTTVVCAGDASVKILSSYCGCTGGGNQYATLHRYLVLSNGSVQDTVLQSALPTMWDCQNAQGANPLCQATK